MKKLSKILSGMLVFILILTMCSVGMTAYAATDDVLGDYHFNITNTYQNVDWANWNKYKAETHVHTVRSDADTEIDDMIEYYYGFGFDAMALTDHGTVNYGWTSGQSRVVIFDYQFFVHGAMDEPSKERYAEITTGTGAVSGGTTPRGYGMREIPLGIELNGMSTKKCHINGFYVDYGHGDLGTTVSWPRDAVAGNYKAGGLTHINHVGEWSDAKDDIGVYDREFIEDFASIYEDYGIMRKGRNESDLRGCLGMELVNTADSRTKNDRYLYDEILKILAPQGINVLAFCEDDAHELSDCDRNAQYFIMPENDMATNNIKHSMMYGEFYACSKNSKQPYELGDGFYAVGAYPSISNLTVDDAKNQIIIDSKDANKIRMVADGEIIETEDISTSGERTVIDLNTYEKKINSYVRIYLTGPGGILYLQPFLVEKEEAHVSTVSFIKPSTDTNVSVFDSNGSLVNPVNTESVYILDAGNYTYTASRPGYLTSDAIPFTVTQAEIDRAEQIKINVSLEKDSNVTYTTFYVPETIYLSGTDLMTFQSYVDRDNSEDGAVNSSVKNTGNIFFSREGASDISITYEIADGIQLGSMTVGQTQSSGSTLSTSITAGKMSSAVPSGGHALLKWTASYKCGGMNFTSNAYTYIYSSKATVAAGGQARTKKNAGWLHTTMHITATLWLAGVNAVSGGGAAYKFSPYGGSALTDVTDIEGLITAGSGMGTATDESAGGSKTVNPVGGTGILTIDTSRYNNLNQIPNLKVGLDINNCAEGEDASSSYVIVGDKTIYSSSEAITSSKTAQRIYESDNTSATNNLNYPLDPSITSITVNGYTSCKKSSRTDAVNGTVTLQLNYVNKGSLRDQVNSAINLAYQRDWFEDQNDYSAYINAIKEAAIVLGNPAATANEISSASSSLSNAVSGADLKEGTLTVNHVDSTTGNVIETETKQYTLCDTIIGSSKEFDGYSYSNSWQCQSGNTAVASGDATFGSMMAIAESYVMTFYYTPKAYSVQYIVSDPSFTADTAAPAFGREYKVASGVPVQEGYVFEGWLLDADGNIYQPGDTFIWNFNDDSTFTAQWDAQKYTATYNLNGGKGLSSLTDTVAYMDSYTITNTIPEKDGYVFAGWTASTAGGEDLGKYTAGSTFSWNRAENVILSAQWTVVTFEVSFNADGGTLNTDKINVNYGDSYGELPVPTKEGFNFDGWYLESTLATPVTASTVVKTASDHTLYAKWSKGQYKITYYINGQLYKETTYNYGDTIIPEPAPSSQGSTFSGWSEIPSVMPANDITVNGSLSVNSYKLKFVIDGTTYSEESVAYGTAITAPVPETKIGYTFSGWSYVPSEMPANDVTVTGSYTANEYTVYYNVDGSNYTSQTYCYGDTIAPYKMPSKTGYTFSGWSNLPDTMPACNVYASGSYTANKYMITYYIDGELYFEEEYEYKASITAYAEPSREGYEFSGWSYIPETMPARNYTVNGSFTANSYSYYFIVDGTVRNELTIKAVFGTPVTAPTVSVPANYSFSGWSPEVPLTMGSQSMNFYGTTSKTSSTVTYSLNGGTGVVPNSETFAVGTVASLPSGGFSKAGYIFDGWSENSTAQSGESTYKVGADNVTLYAVWKQISVRLDPAENSTTVVDNIVNIICGVKERITSFDFLNDYVDVIGENGNVEIETRIGFGTGSKVNLYESDTLVKTYQLVVYGDVDGDGVADGMDVQIATMIKDGILTKAQVGEAVWEAADCDHNGTINNNDIQIIIDSGIKLQVVDQTK